MPSVILFGAGASYGSEPSIRTPPLGAALFEALQKFNPDGWGSVGEPLASSFRTDFEAGIAALSVSNSHALPVLQRAMAAFFFRFAPTADSLYVQLATRIRKANWSGSLATLNYERLLEICLSHAGVRPVVNESTSADTVELCMPHGCCHLFCESARGSASAVSFSGMNVTTNGPVVPISDASGFNTRITQDAFPPVMSYFEPKKRTTSGANFIDSQRQRWQQLCSSASVIAIVGVFPRQNDTHIWEPLVNSNARIVYCAGRAGGAAYDYWSKSVGRPSIDTVLNGYFADEFQIICESVGL